jgi:hypothetical protein
MIGEVFLVTSVCGDESEVDLLKLGHEARVLALHAEADATVAFEEFAQLLPVAALALDLLRRRRGRPWGRWRGRGRGCCG